MVAKTISLTSRSVGAMLVAVHIDAIEGYHMVCVFTEDAVERGPHFHARPWAPGALQDHPVLLLHQHRQGIGFIIGCCDDLEEERIDRFSSGLVDACGGDQHAAERAHRVASEGGIPRLTHCGAYGCPTGIVVFKYREGHALDGAKVVDQLNRSVQVEQVVVAEFLAVQLLEHAT
jgi:hypothetical protein